MHVAFTWSWVKNRGAERSLHATPSHREQRGPKRGKTVAATHGVLIRYVQKVSNDFEIYEYMFYVAALICKTRLGVNTINKIYFITVHSPITL